MKPKIRTVNVTLFSSAKAPHNRPVVQLEVDGKASNETLYDRAIAYYRTCRGDRIPVRGESVKWL